MAQGGWAPTQEEAALLSTGDAIVYMHAGCHEVVRLDAFPKELAAYQRQQERRDAKKVQRDLLRQSAPHGVKISKKLARAKGLL